MIFGIILIFSCSLKIGYFESIDSFKSISGEDTLKELVDTIPSATVFIVYVPSFKTSSVLNDILLAKLFL